MSPCDTNLSQIIIWVTKGPSPCHLQEVIIVEQTFVMIKPDGVERGLTGEIISRLEKKGFKIVALKMMHLDAGMAAGHYAEHRGKPFFEELVGFITSGPVVAMILAGRGAIAMVRTMMGATDPGQAAPGTIRGDLALDINRNIIHGSDSAESARREIEIFFSREEIFKPSAQGGK